MHTCVCVKKAKNYKHEPKILMAVSESSREHHDCAFSRTRIIQSSVSVCVCVLGHISRFFFGLVLFLLYNVMCTVLLYNGLCFLVAHFLLALLDFISFIRQFVENWCACASFWIYLFWFWIGWNQQNCLKNLYEETHDRQYASSTTTTTTNDNCSSSSISISGCNHMDSYKATNQSNIFDAISNTLFYLYLTIRTVKTSVCK